MISLTPNTPNTYGNCGLQIDHLPEKFTRDITSYLQDSEIVTFACVNTKIHKMFSGQMNAAKMAAGIRKHSGTPDEYLLLHQECLAKVNERKDKNYTMSPLERCIVLNALAELLPCMPAGSIVAEWRNVLDAALEMAPTTGWEIVKKLVPGEFFPQESRRKTVLMFVEVTGRYQESEKLRILEALYDIGTWTPSTSDLTNFQTAIMATCGRYHSNRTAGLLMGFGARLSLNQNGLSEAAALEFFEQLWPVMADYSIGERGYILRWLTPCVLRLPADSRLSQFKALADAVPALVGEDAQQIVILKSLADMLDTLPEDSREEACEHLDTVLKGLPPKIRNGFFAKLDEDPDSDA